MTDDHVRDATRRFRRRVSHGSARRRYLTPEMRVEAEEMRTMLDKLATKLAGSRRAKRVRRMRQGATVRQSRSARWKEQTLLHDDDE